MKIICYQCSILPFCKKKRALREAWRICRTEFYIAFHQYNLFCRQAQANIPFHLPPWSQSDVMFAHFAARRNSTHAVNITARGYITCPQGQTSFQTKEHCSRSALLFGGATRNRTGDKGFADPCLTAWPWRLMLFVTNADANESHPHCSGADYGARTRHLRLGKATLYQMS